MAPRSEPDDPPSIELAGLKIWVDGYAPSNGNWLIVTAHCNAPGATVRVKGDGILDSAAFARWQQQLQSVYDTLRGDAVLNSYEPELWVTVAAVGHAGHVRVRVEITPDCVDQMHRFDFDLDQSYLPPVIKQCQTLLSKYPVQ